MLEMLLLNILCHRFWNSGDSICWIILFHTKIELLIFLLMG